MSTPNEPEPTRRDSTHTFTAPNANASSSDDTAATRPFLEEPVVEFKVYKPPAVIALPQGTYTSSLVVVVVVPIHSSNHIVQTTFFLITVILEDLPDDYFTPTIADLKERQRQLHQQAVTLNNAPLLTRAQREQQIKTKRDRWPNVSFLFLCLSSIP
jgi:hypothetical protein